MTRPLLNRRLAGLGTTIFAEMSELAVATGSVNLGQGFPDTDGPPEIARAAADAILAGRGNQYPPGAGIPELRAAIAEHQRRFYGWEVDPGTEVLVTAGATEAIAAAVLAELAVRQDLLVISDEVYEHLVFSGEHVPIASLPGMSGRTATISSAAKTFSFTGWKIGWVTGSAEMVTAVRTTKQFLTFVSGGPFQYAIAQALALPEGYYQSVAADLRIKRDLMCDGLAEAGF